MELAILCGIQVVAPCKTASLVANWQIKIAGSTVGAGLDQAWVESMWSVGLSLDGPLDNDMIGSTMAANPSSRP